MNNVKYLEPDIPADEGWRQIKKMLDNVPAGINTANQGKSLLKQILLYGGAGIVFISAIVYFLSSNKPHQHSPTIIYSSHNNPQKEILSNGVVAFLDRQSNIIEEAEASNENIIDVKGAVYFENTQGNQPVLKIKAGSAIVLPQNARIYVSFDTSSGISSFHIQSGNALLEVGDKKLNLAAGESVQYNERTKHLEEKKKADINLFAYSTKVLVFKDTPLKEASVYIEKTYGATIHFAKKELNNCRITTRFDNKSLKDVLDIMSYTLNFRYTLDEKSNLVILNGEGCE